MGPGHKVGVRRLAHLEYGWLGVEDGMAGAGVTDAVRRGSCSGNGGRWVRVPRRYGFGGPSWKEAAVCGWVAGLVRARGYDPRMGRELDEGFTPGLVVLRRLQARGFSGYLYERYL